MSLGDPTSWPSLWKSHWVPRRYQSGLRGWARPRLCLSPPQPTHRSTETVGRFVSDRLGGRGRQGGGWLEEWASKREDRLRRGVGRRRVPLWLHLFRYRVRGPVRE